eukprot:scaffold4422_cov110-Skeletonema_dohrnii-CCMP3373.AAC.6
MPSDGFHRSEVTNKMDEKDCRTSTPPVAPHLTSKLASALVLSPSSDSDRCLKVLYRVGMNRIRINAALGSWDFNAREMTPLIEARRSSLGGSRHPSRILGTSWNYEVNDEQTEALTVPPPPPREPCMHFGID